MRVLNDERFVPLSYKTVVCFKYEVAKTFVSLYFFVGRLCGRNCTWIGYNTSYELWRIEKEETKIEGGNLGPASEVMFSLGNGCWHSRRAGPLLLEFDIFRPHLDLTSNQGQKNKINS